MAIKRADQTSDQAQPDVTALGDMTGASQAVTKVSADDVALGAMGGDVGDVGLRLPYLQVSHAQGKLEAFRKGSIVIGNDNLIANPGEKLLVTILAARVYWKEYFGGETYDPDKIPRTFATKDEVHAAGGTTEWKDGNGPTFKIAVAAKALVKQPAGVVCGLFGVRIGDADYAPVLWNTDKSAAARVAPVIKSDLQFSLRKRGLYSGIYEMTTQSVKFASGFSAFVPTIRLVGYHTDDEVKQILDLFKLGQAEAAEVTET